MYAKALKTWEPLLAERGFMTLLTSEERMLLDAARRNGLHCKRVGQMRVKGILAGIFQVK